MNIRTKQILSVIFLILTVAFFVFLFSFKATLTDYTSNMMKSQSTVSANVAIENRIDSAYNYQQNGGKYKITFLEFGANGCSACMKMEKVMDEIKHNYPDKVNVVFLNVMHLENQEYIKYFGIASIPMQILLDENGKEFFRHNGYFSTDSLSKIINQKL